MPYIESKDCESGVDSEPAGGMDSDEESEIGGDTASVEDNKLGDEEDLSQVCTLQNFQNF